MGEVLMWLRWLLLAVLLLGLLALMLTGVAVWLVSGEESIFRLDDGVDYD